MAHDVQPDDASPATLACPVINRGVILGVDPGGQVTISCHRAFPLGDDPPAWRGPGCTRMKTRQRPGRPETGELNPPGGASRRASHCSLQRTCDTPLWPSARGFRRIHSPIGRLRSGRVLPLSRVPCWRQSRKERDRVRADPGSPSTGLTHPCGRPGGRPGWQPISPKLCAPSDSAWLWPSNPSQPTWSSPSWSLQSGPGCRNQKSSCALPRRSWATIPAEVHNEMIGGSPAASIIQVPTAWNSSLIVMGTRGRSTMADLMPGSTSQKVVSHAPCPVLIVR